MTMPKNFQRNCNYPMIPLIKDLAFGWRSGSSFRIVARHAARVTNTAPLWSDTRGTSAARSRSSNVPIALTEPSNVEISISTYEPIILAKTCSRVMSKRRLRRFYDSIFFFSLRPFIRVNDNLKF